MGRARRRAPKKQRKTGRGPSALASMRAARAALVAGRQGEAARHLEAAVQADPSAPGPQVALARVRLDMGDLVGACRVAERLLARDPHNVAAQTALADALIQRGRHDRALGTLEDIAARHPKDAGARATLGDCQVLLGRLDEAERSYRVAEALDPALRSARVGLALVYEQRGQAAEAVGLLEPWVEAGQRDSPMITIWANAARAAGRVDEAVKALREASSLPNAPLERARVAYALGACLSKRGDYDEAFEAYRRANEAVEVPYSPDEHEAWVDRELGAFTPERFACYVKNDEHDERPVFIVGMPRSGTSLTEQILERHPDVVATGELSAMADAQAALPELLKRPHAEHYAAVTTQATREVARHWLAAATAIDARAATAKRVTDKMPENYSALGLIALAFPGARVIHCRRDPRDVALSCYFQNFGRRMPFSRRLDWIGHRIRQQERMMRHFREVLPLDFFELSYEDLVRNPEPKIRRLLQFCGLDFHDACLHPERSDRHVATASYAQVRRPINASSAGRYRRYERFLGPLNEALGDEIVSRALA